jgi:hypothetical protein
MIYLIYTSSLYKTSQKHKEDARKKILGLDEKKSLFIRVSGDEGPMKKNYTRKLIKD